MNFVIGKFDKNRDRYCVQSESNEQVIATGLQIVNVMIAGHTFINAYPTNKGFCIRLNDGRSTYVQVPMDKETSKHLVEFVKQMHNAKRVENKITKKVEIQGRRNDKKVYFKGTMYYSIESICRKFNRDVDTFNELYNMGYSLEECLGLVALRDPSVLRPRSVVTNALNALDKQRGEY